MLLYSLCIQFDTPVAGAGLSGVSASAGVDDISARTVWRTKLTDRITVVARIRELRDERNGGRVDHRLRRFGRRGGLEPRRDANENPLSRTGRLDETIRLP